MNQKCFSQFTNRRISKKGFVSPILNYEQKITTHNKEWGKRNCRNENEDWSLTSVGNTLNCGRLRCLRVVSGTTPSRWGLYILRPVGWTDPRCLSPISKPSWDGFIVLCEALAVGTLNEAAGAWGRVLILWPLIPWIGGDIWWKLWCWRFTGEGWEKLALLLLLAGSWYRCRPIFPISIGPPLRLFPTRKCTEVLNIYNNWSIYGYQEQNSRKKYLIIH